MAHDCFEGNSVLAMDLETTGVDAKRDKIVQFAFIGSLAEDEEIKIEELVNPKRAIPYETSNIHGIFNSDVAGLSGFDAHANLIHEMIDGTVIVGHNVRRFDLEFITHEFLRIGRHPPEPFAIIDTLEVVRRLKLPRPHNLGALCKKYSIELVNAHTAAADAAATLLLLWRLMKDHPSHFRRTVTDIEQWLVGSGGRSGSENLGPGLNDLEPVDREGRIRRDGDSMVLAFGRHRASTIKVVQKTDPGYINGLISPSSLLDEDAREKVKVHVSNLRSS